MRIQTPTLFNFVAFAVVALGLTIFLFGETNQASAEFDSLSSYPAVKSVSTVANHGLHR